MKLFGKTTQLRQVLLLMIIPLLCFSSCKKEEEGRPSGGSGEQGGGRYVPSEWTVSGTVKGNDNKPIADVVVSDGYVCVKTDAQGRYELPVDLSGNLTETLQYVFVSTPSGWAAPVQQGHAIFWKWLKDFTKGSDGKITGVDFTLTKIANPERYTVFIFADPQPRDSNKWREVYDRSAFKSLDICEDMYTDMQEYAATFSDRPVYGIGLGDIIHQDVSLLEKYRTGMAKTGITTYNVIGNHDQQHMKGMTDVESSRAFEQYMGPTNYSFNLGGMHYLMLDNMIIRAGSFSDDCATGLTDDIWTFVQNDLALVSRDTPLMVCAHSPMCRLPEGDDRGGKHLSEFRGLLSKYKKAYVWAGHSHNTFNYVDKNNPIIETHTVSRVTGALWTNEYLSENGTPRGYIVFDYNNGDVSWKFKPLFWQKAVHCQKGKSTKVPPYKYRDWTIDDSGRAILKQSGQPLTDSYQMQVFPPGTYADNDQTVYVNVFLWDELWIGYREGTTKFSKPVFKLDGTENWKAMSPVTDKIAGGLLRYSMADWDISTFYAGVWSVLNSKWFGGEIDPDDPRDPEESSDAKKKKSNCYTMFRYTLNTTDEHGSGIVKVTDRFGKTWSQSISW